MANPSSELRLYLNSGASVGIPIKNLLGFVIELPVSRCDPAAVAVPSKIRGLRGKGGLLLETIKAAGGYSNPP
jgi:hypothetical protein